MASLELQFVRMLEREKRPAAGVEEVLIVAACRTRGDGGR